MHAFVDRPRPGAVARPTAGRRRRRGVVAPGPRARARPPGRRRGPGPAPASQSRRAGRGPASCWPASPRRPNRGQVAAEARLAAQQVEVPADGVDVLLDALLARVKDDEDARQEFLDLLETLGPDDPRAPATARRCPPPCSESCVDLRAAGERDGSLGNRAPGLGDRSVRPEPPGPWSWASSTGPPTPSTTRAPPSRSTPC